MRRVFAILGSFLACTALLAWIVYLTAGETALERGRTLYWYRTFFDQTFARRQTRERPLLLWLGDSTIMRFSRPSYPHLLRDRVRTKRDADTLVVAFPGFDPYSYYFVTGRLLESVDPAVVAIVAHLRGFNAARGQHAEFRYNDLSSYVTPGLLPRTFLLPLAERELSPARVLLAQSLGLAGPEGIFYAAEGLRLLYDEAPSWQALGPRDLPFVYDPREWDALRGYGVTLSRRQPAVEMLEATVRLVVESGRIALVVVNPIPMEAMRTRPWFDPVATRRNLDVLRDVVQEAGGIFADLHDLLPQSEFKDYGGHYSAAGAVRVSNAVWPFVREALRLARQRRAS